MHASGGVPAACAYSIRKVIRRKRHKEIVVTVQHDSVAAEIVSVCVARGVVGGAYKRYIPSRIVASKSSQRLDVQLNGLDDRHAVRLPDALPD